MSAAKDGYARSPEALVVGLARAGDRDAFAELVRRRQSGVRNLMRRLCSDVTLADDLAQKAFLQAWLKIRQLKKVNSFAGWLKRLAVTTWLQYLRKNDALRNADEYIEDAQAVRGVASTSGMALDLDRALARLPAHVRTCIVLSYHEGMTNNEVAVLTELPPGTVKSHIRRGTQKLQQYLSAYNETGRTEETP